MKNGIPFLHASLSFLKDRYRSTIFYSQNIMFQAYITTAYNILSTITIFRVYGAE